MRVLVTGAGGYVGAAVVDALRQAGHEPIAMLRRPPDDGRAPDYAVRLADLRDPEDVARAVEGTDAVCHLAGLVRARESWERAREYFDVNVTGTVTLLDALRRHGVTRFVLASTSAIYGTPSVQQMHEGLPDAVPHPYAASKRAAELAVEALCRGGALGAAILRLLNVAGGRDDDQSRIVPKALAVASGKADKLLINGDGRAVRDLVHVTDVAEAFVAAVEQCPEPGQSRIYNIASGRGCSVLDVIGAVERVTGCQVPVQHGPPAAEPRELVGDPSRARAELGWLPERSQLDTIVADAWQHWSGAADRQV